MRRLLLISPLLLMVAACSPTIKYVCPSLSAPPESTLDALQKATASGDTDTASWVIDLDRWYQKCDAVNAYGTLRLTGR